jgi:putative acetyltransferase
VGHILFSPVTVKQSGLAVEGMALGPLAVLPDHQRQGVGSALIRSGLELLGARACPFVVVLGHPEYYPRFGFEPASGRGIRSQWEGLPDEVFMILILDELRMENVGGVAWYRHEFDQA